MNPKSKNSRWEVISKLGSGSYGAVFLIALPPNQTLKDGGFAAMKVIDKSLMQNVIEYGQEVDLLKTMKHKNIVSYYGAAITDKDFRIFLEYVPGGSLERVLNSEKKLNETLTAGWVKDIMEGLLYLHSNNIIHRDIKPGNILINIDGSCKITDFGSSVFAAEMDQCSIKGTALYLAPEIAKKQQGGKPSDVWALGITVIKMLTGSPPRQDEFIQRKIKGLHQILYFIRESNDPNILIPNHLSNLVKSFLQQCLSINPSERETIDNLLKHEWITTLGDNLKTEI